MVVTPFFISTLLQVSTLDHNIGIVRGTSNIADSHHEHTIVPDRRLSNYDEVLAFSVKSPECTATALPRTSCFRATRF